MSTELATMPAQSRMTDVLDVVRHLDQLWNLADILVKSRMLPDSIKTPEAAVAIILKGRELGIGTMAAFAGIIVIQGKPTVSPQLMLSLINRSGLLEDMDVVDEPDACTITVKRVGRSPQTVSFTRSEAIAMQLATKDNWRKQFGVMMYNRAVAKMGRRVFPDVIDGLYTPEEMGAETGEDGEIIEGEIVPAQKFPDQGSGHGRTGSYAHDDHDAAFRKMLIECNADLLRDWKQAWKNDDDLLPAALPEQPVRSYEVIMHLYDEDVKAGRLQEVQTTVNEVTGEVVPKASIEQLRKMVAIAFSKDPAGVRVRVERYMHRQAMNVAVDFIDAHPGEMIPMDFDPEYNQEPDEAPEDQSQEAAEPLPPPEPAKKMSKKELAEKTRLRLIEEAKLRAAQHGDAYEGDIADADADPVAEPALKD